MGKYDFEEELSDGEEDLSLRDEIEALSRACMHFGTSDKEAESLFVPDDDDTDDDLELVRDIVQLYGDGVSHTQPLVSLPPTLDDDDDDDFETLRAIQRRFSGYCDSDVGANKDSSYIQEKPGPNEVVDVSLDVHGHIYDDDDPCKSRSCDIAGTGNGQSSSSTPNFLMMMEAIKKNRLCQKFLRKKMVDIDARREEIKVLQKRLKALVDFQVQCKKKISRELSLKQDAHIRLFSTPKQRANDKGVEKNVSAMCYGPPENSHVACYKKALEKFPLQFKQRKWSIKERQALEKGVLQQFQANLLINSTEELSALENHGFANGVDDIISAIRNQDITPEALQDFVRKVNWTQVADMYVHGSRGKECETRWLNFENRLINWDNWTAEEDKLLLFLIQQNGVHDWGRIANLKHIAEKSNTNKSLEKFRTPFQCLVRFQRSLNASILKRDWTADEDAQLRSAVVSFGESNWQAVASGVEGRTGTQCSNRWKKTLNPARQRVGRWSGEEDKRLKVAVTLFGHKSWHRIAQFVPGRTQAQCRERWVNVLDPSLNLGEWTVEDDLKLKAAIAEYGYSWSKVAACVPLRTDNQCRRRWKKLFPDEVPLLKAARTMQKAALISNFVDRESERPALGPSDFVPLAIMNSTSVPENDVPKKRKKLRKVSEADATRKLTSSGVESEDRNTETLGSPIKIRSRRSQGVGRRNNSKATGVYNTDTNTMSSKFCYENTDSEMPQSSSDMASQKLFSTEILHKNSCVEEMITSSNISETNCMDGAGLNNLKAHRQHKKSKLHSNQSEAWEDLPLAILFSGVVSRKQRHSNVRFHTPPV